MSYKNRKRSKDRAEWIAPQLRRLAASEAELSPLGILPDGGVEQFS